MKIREYIILLTDRQEKELIKRSNESGIDDDLGFLQDHINKWLNDDNSINHKEK